MKRYCAMAAAIGALGAAPALAQKNTVPEAAYMVRAQDPASVVRALQGGGYTATLGTDKVGDPM